MTAPGDRVPRQAWMIMALLFLVQMVNFIDKSVVGVAGATIMRDLGLTPVQFGAVGSSFFALYAVSGVIVGLVAAPRVAPRKILGVLMGLWILAQFPVLLIGTLSSLIVSRMLLGVGEGAGTPTSLNTAYEWFPPSMRSMPTALLFFGNMTGTIVGAPLLSYVIVGFGWQAAFGTCALLGAAVLLLWLPLSREGPWATVGRVAAPATGQDDGGYVPSQRRIWLDPSIIGVCIVSFCSYWMFSFNVSWMAPYVKLGLGYGTLETGWIVAGINVSHALMLFILPTWSDRLMKRGVTSRRARGTMTAVALLVAAVSAVAAAWATEPVTKIVLLAFATGLPHVALVFAPTIVSEIAPDRHRNRLIAVIFSATTLSGLIGPVASGWLIGGGGGYDSSLILLAILAIVGAIAAAVLIDPEATRRRLAIPQGEDVR